jgi:integrase
VLFRSQDCGERITPVPDELAAILAPLVRKSGRVVGVSLGNANRRFEAFLKAYGMAGHKLTPHSCRHTYVGIMTATGEPAGVVRLYVGHSADAMTHHYAEAAARFRSEVEGWQRGDLQLMEGVVSAWPRITKNGNEKVAQTLRTGGKFLGVVK